MVIIAAFCLNHGGVAFAHGEAEPEPAKPAAAQPAPEPLPPRPTEYPRGLNEKPRPGEAGAQPHSPPGQKPAEAKDGEPKAKDPTKPGAEPIKEAAPSPHPGTQQPMPAPVAGEKAGEAPKSGEGMIQNPNDIAAKAAHWVPPKRYHFVMDSYTGLAMGGHDPVAFFVNGEAELGSADHEFDWGGTTWHFLNEGNLAAFKQNPDVYAPQFGGRCAYALSQGLLVEGNPQFFVIHRDRLYLFANAGYRAAFLTNPDAIAAEATREWPVLTRNEP